MNAKLAILSVVLCMVAAGQSIHLHPNGQSLVFSLPNSTNTFTTDRKKTLDRMRRFQSEIDGLKHQLGTAQKWMIEHPPRIAMMEQEMETLRFHLKMFDIMGATNAPTPAIVMPPMPPALPVNASVRSGLPSNHQPEFIPRRDVMTAKD